MPRARSAALGRRGAAPPPGPRGLAWTPGAPRTRRRSGRQPRLRPPRRAAPSPQRVAGLNCGGARPRFRPCPDRPIPSSPPPPPNPGARRRSRPGVRPTVPETAVAPEPLLPLPPLAMGPGPRLLLPLALCVGLGALVPSAGASRVGRRGPSVTAKVTERRAATCLRARQGDGGSLGTGSSASAAARRGASRAQAKRGGRRAGGGRGLPARGGGAVPGDLGALGRAV